MPRSLDHEEDTQQTAKTRERVPNSQEGQPSKSIGMANAPLKFGRTSQFGFGVR